MTNKKVNFTDPDAHASWGQINLASFDLNSVSQNGSGKKTYHAMREVIKFLVYDRAIYEDTETYELRKDFLTMKDVNKLIGALKVPAKIETAFKVEIKKKRPTTKRKAQPKAEISLADISKALGISTDDLKKIKSKSATKPTSKKRI